MGHSSGKRFALQNFLTLAVAVEHHAAVRACDIGRCEVLTGILICYYNVIHIIHRIQRNLIGFTHQRMGEIHDGNAFLASPFIAVFWITSLSASKVPSRFRFRPAEVSPRA